jgi:hypothetical protein
MLDALLETIGTLGILISLAAKVRKPRPTVTHAPPHTPTAVKAGSPCRLVSRRAAAPDPIDFRHPEESLHPGRTWD